MEQILELMKSMQEELRTHGTKMEETETNRKADHEALKEMTARMEAKIEAYQEKADADQEQMKEITAGQEQRWPGWSPTRQRWTTLSGK
jgi:chromosome segregation ATPase